jgi:hypothetical protein
VDYRGSGKTFYNGDIKIKCANRQTTRRSIWHRSKVMQDLLQYIDVDYYRSTQLLVVRAEIAQLRGQSPALARTEPQCKIPTGAARPVADLHQTAHATPIVQSGSRENAGIAER